MLNGKTQKGVISKHNQVQVKYYLQISKSESISVRIQKKRKRCAAEVCARRLKKSAETVEYGSMLSRNRFGTKIGKLNKQVRVSTIGLAVGHWQLTKTHTYTNFVINTHYLIFRHLFWRKKPPEGTAPASTRGLEASNHLVWRHPITLRSLVVKHTAWTQNWANFFFDTFSPISKNTNCSKKFHINDLELSFSATFAEFRCASYSCWKKHAVFVILIF